MRWIRAVKHINWRGGVLAGRTALVVWVEAIVVVAAFIACLAPFVTPPTDENPTGDAGLYAPVVALCVAAMILAEAVQARRRLIRPIPGIFIGMGSMASAYLWIADEAEAHPLDFEVPVFLLVLLAAAALGTLVVPINSLMSKQRSNNEADS